VPDIFPLPTTCRYWKMEYMCSSATAKEIERAGENTFQQTFEASLNPQQNEQKKNSLHSLYS